MEKSNRPVIKITELGQVCIVVQDIEKTMKSMWNIFGIGPWSVNIRDDNWLSEMTYRGKPAHFAFKVARTLKLAGNEIELIQPLEGDNIYSDFLREHGDGIHHLGWHKVDTQKAFDETRRDLERAGFPCITSATTRIGAFAYFDTTKVLDTILEVIWHHSESKIPPARVFPE